MKAELSFAPTVLNESCINLHRKKTKRYPFVLRRCSVSLQRSRWCLAPLRLSPNSLVVCTPNGFQMKSLMELQLGPSAIPLVKALNKLQAIGYEFTHPPHGIAVSRNEKYFRIRVPRSFAMAHLDSMWWTGRWTWAEKSFGPVPCRHKVEDWQWMRTSL